MKPPTIALSILAAAAIFGVGVQQGQKQSTVETILKNVDATATVQTPAIQAIVKEKIKVETEPKMHSGVMTSEGIAIPTRMAYQSVGVDGFLQGAFFRGDNSAIVTFQVFPMPRLDDDKACMVRFTEVNKPSNEFSGSCPDYQLGAQEVTFIDNEGAIGTTIFRFN